MPTSFDAIKNRTYDGRASRAQMDGEQQRRDRRAALHELQQRLDSITPSVVTCRLSSQPVRHLR